jgi:predicted HAD superfamily Cof-like phosphohydrolase
VTSLAQKQYDRGFSDAGAGHSPSLLRGSYMTGYSDAKSGRPRRALEKIMTKPEAVDHPSHYGGKDNPYEAIKVIEAWGAGFNVGNALKYICRAESKGAERQDYQKACWYLLRELSTHEGRSPNFYNDLVKAASVPGGKSVMVTGDPVALDPTDHKVKVLASVCMAGMCDHIKFGSECPDYGVPPEQATMRDAVLLECADLMREVYGEYAQGAEKILDLGSDAIRIRPMVPGGKLGQPKAHSDRCGRCLLKVPEKTFMHDCSGEGLEPDHYVSRLEGHLEDLGRGLSSLEIEPKGRESGVDAALRVVAAQVREITGLKEKINASPIMATARSLAAPTAQTPHQLRVERMMRGFGQDIPSQPLEVADDGLRILRARLIMEECLETVQDGLGVEVSDLGSNVVAFDDLHFEAVPGKLNMIELADGCADVSVVTIGTLSAFGIKDAPLLREVDANNQAKIDTGRTDEHGKFVKHPDHKAPDVAGVLEAQRARRSPFITS